MVRISQSGLDCLYAGTTPPRKSKNKYNAVKTEREGHKFHSTGEGDRYVELRFMQDCGIITHLKRQPSFLLQEGFIRGDGKKINPIFYVADFDYWRDGERIIEDFKGLCTPAYKLKRKMFWKRYPHLTHRETFKK